MLQGGWGGCPPYALTVQRAGSGSSSGAKFAPSPAPPPACWSSLGKEKAKGKEEELDGHQMGRALGGPPLSLKRRGPRAQEAAGGALLAGGGRAAPRGSTAEAQQNRSGGGSRSGGDGSGAGAAARRGACERRVCSSGAARGSAPFLQPL